jgi:hypothetical protein
MSTCYMYIYDIHTCLHKHQPPVTHVITHAPAHQPFLGMNKSVPESGTAREQARQGHKLSVLLHSRNARCQDQ